MLAMRLAPEIQKRIAALAVGIRSSQTLYAVRDDDPEAFYLAENRLAASNDKLPFVETSAPATLPVSITKQFNCRLGRVRPENDSRALRLDVRSAW